MTDMNIESLKGLAINDEGFAFDPRTGESFTVNASGRRIIEALLAGDAKEIIATTLAADFQISEMEARTDVRDFMEQLRALRLAGAAA